MRILLINPVESELQGYQSTGSFIPQLGLQVLARLTPKEHSVDIIDEIFNTDQTENLLTARRYDLVGITAYTCQASRAYHLASICRSRNLPTIMGGPHAWAVPDEAAQHFDSVVIGEADTIWPKIIADAAEGKLQPRYQGCLAELTDQLGAAAQHLQPINGRYDVSCIQTSRGCPVGCKYCSVTAFNGAKIRRRPIGEIIEEWNTTTSKFIFVVDDNFFGLSKNHTDWAKELLRAIIKHGKKRLWFSQTTINMGNDIEATRLAYKAGCRGMLVGLESFNPKNLKACHKQINYNCIDEYRTLVDGFHRGGLAVFGAFIVGVHEDTPDTVADTIFQANKIGVDIIQITNLTPLPGTGLFNEYIAGNRIFANNFPQDWKRFSFIETVYHPQSMTARQLDESIYELRHAAANRSWVWKRSLKSLIKTRSISTALFVHNINSAFVRLAKAIAPRDAKNFGFTPSLNHRTQKIHQAMTLRMAAQSISELPPEKSAVNKQTTS